jgi:methionine synthase I (cobalamin-dependent)
LQWLIIVWKVWFMNLTTNPLKSQKKVADDFTENDPLKPRFVAGAMGPTNRTASLSPDVNRPEYRAVTFNELRIAYKQQVEALIDGGVDGIVAKKTLPNIYWFQIFFQYIHCSFLLLLFLDLSLL